MDKIKTTNTNMTHKEILEQTKAELDRLVSEAKRKLDDLVKPELEVGKWYKGAVDFESLIYITEVENVGEYNNIHGYGFKRGGWNSLGHLLSNTDHEKSLVEATDQEVEEALVKEAMRRGFVNGAIVNNSNVHNTRLENYELFFNNEFDFNEKGNTLRIIIDDESTWHVFKDGIWAEVIEKPVDKFAELKEAYKNGEVIEYRHASLPNASWKINNNPAWNTDFEYRIKPEEKPKAGDVFIVKIKSDKDIDRLLKFESYDRV